MAFSALPTDVIAGWSNDGTDVTFPIASVDQLDAAESDAVTGDSRRILFALMEQYYQWYVALPVADRPGQMTISKSSQLQSDGTFKNTYSTVFYCAVTDQEVVDEVV
jgi:hypothetical protein